MNIEHLEILNSGTQNWNIWREENPNIIPNLFEANLRERDLSNTDFRNTNMRNTTLVDADLTKSDFRGADLSGSNLMGVKLLNSDLTNCKLAFTNLQFTNLTGVNLTNVDLRGGDLKFSSLKHSQIVKCGLINSVFGDTTISQSIIHDAVGLETIRFELECSIDIQTLMMSDNLPTLFLRGMGLNDILIENFPSLKSNPFQFYSCFISYTEADDEFSEKLYYDLWSRNIKSWRWREDLKKGKTIRYEIENAIKFHDKLIIILSKDSLKSEPVIDEIDAAILREKRLRRENPLAEYLFPVRLDDTIFSWEHPNQRYIIQKNIADFKEWYKSAEYSKEFEAIVKALRR